MTLKSRCADFAYFTYFGGRGVLSEHARSVSVLWLQAGRCSCSVSVSVLLAMAGGRKRASGRKKTLAELGVRRLPKAREMWAAQFFEGAGLRGRRLRGKQPVYSHAAMWHKWKALPKEEQDIWLKAQTKIKKKRAEVIQERKSAMSAPRAATKVAGAEPVNAALPVAPPIIGDVSTFPWCDERSGSARKLVLSSTRPLPLGGGSYGLCMAVADPDTGEAFCAKIAKEGGGASTRVESLKTEYDVLQRCSHPNIIRPHALITIPSAAQRLVLLLPCCDRNLTAWLHDDNAAPLGEGAVGKVWQTSCLLQVARALSHVHGIGFLHFGCEA